ncbi:MAG: acetylxylan esterase [Prevotella sp.]|nr:acetylxylan esterase [Prevotella sp.]
MRRLFYLTIILLFSAWHTPVQAENYPYRSDVLWVTTPNHADWLYRVGEQAEVEVQFFRYGMPCDGELEYAIGNDLLDSDMQGTCKLRKGYCTIKMGTAKKPCFRDLRLTLHLDGQTYRHHVKVGFSPEQIRPFTKLPSDFQQYWEQAKDEIAKLPLNYTIEPYEPYSNDRVETYIVKLQIDGKRHSLYGYLMKPRGAKPGSCPVVLTPPGAGVKTIKQAYERTYFQEQGVIRFVTEIHGLDPRLSDDTFNDLSRAFGNYLEMGLEHRDNYYMRHVYLGLVRSIDFLTSLPEWDGRNVCTLGGSQGGALSLIAAALDPRVTLCVANHPALSDMAAASQPGLTHGYPHFRRELLTPVAIQTLSYYDVVNFAPFIKCPTYMTWGYNDNTCPPTTSYAVWNLLQCSKEHLITPINEHWTSDTTNRQQLTWLLQHLNH